MLLAVWNNFRAWWKEEVDLKVYRTGISDNLGGLLCICFGAQNIDHSWEYHGAAKFIKTFQECISFFNC